MIKKKKLVLIGMSIIVTILVMGLTGLSGIAEGPPVPASEATVEEDVGCTQLIVTGRAAWDLKTRNGGTYDTTPRPYKFVKLTIDEETGIKVLWDMKSNKKSAVGGLNSYGVCQKGGARPGPAGSEHRCAGWADKDEGYLLECAWMKADYPDAKRFDRDYTLAHARSAKEAVEMCIENLPEGTYEITPVRDAALSHSNFFLSPSGLLQWANVNKEYSENRAERVQELLDERSWFKSTSAQGEISTAYSFSILRDHQYPFDPVASYAKDNRGNISRWGSIARTAYAYVCEVPREYTDLLSILFMTPNWPLTSPFLPFYIGITEVPKTFVDGPTNESGVFQELFNAVSYNLGYLDEVQSFWEAFDHNTIRDKVQLEKVIEDLVDDGNREEAERLLTKFCNDKCELAVAYAKELTKEIISRGLIEVDVSVYVP